jgi:hypothetical protein
MGTDSSVPGTDAGNAADSGGSTKTRA